MIFLARALSTLDIVVIVGIVLAAIFAGLYYLNKWAAKRQSQQQKFVDSSKMDVTIFVLDKKRDKADKVNLPKAVTSQLPKMYKFMKMYFVQAKVGPQIVTLMCDKRVFQNLPVKKNVKIELAGIYISNIKGLKSEYEKKQQAKAKKEQEKREKATAKEAAKRK